MNSGVHRGQCIGERHAVGVVEVNPQLDLRPSRHKTLAQMVNVGRIGHSRRRGHIESLASEIDQLREERLDSFLCNRPFVGAEEGHADCYVNARPHFAAYLQDLVYILHEILHASVLILAAVCLGHGDECDQHVRASSDGPLRSLAVGHQRPVGDSRGAFDAGHHLLRVGHLRDHLGMDERGRLDGCDPGTYEDIDHRDLVFGRNHLVEALKAVARPHFGDRDSVGDSQLPTQIQAAYAFVVE